MKDLPVRVILSRPRNPDNIGAAARAMANFGFGDLAVVAPHAPTWKETSETAATAGGGEPVWLMERARAAVGAADIIRSARVCATLAEAASDCGLLLGTSALQRRTPNRDVVSLSGLAGYMAARLPAGTKLKAGLLFGTERTGLTNEELSYCHAVINIPTREKQPSINLGQAVALVCYELAGRSSAALDPEFCFAPPRAARPRQVISVQETERVMSEIFALLDETKGSGPGGRREHEAEIRRALLDARLTKGAMGVFMTLLRRARSRK
jgi:tRNA/rRNA methyltransferase